MRRKQITILVVVVCLFSILTNNALAFYNPQTGHWLSRDPIEEQGGNNIYAFAANDCIDQVDVLGMATAPAPSPAFNIKDIPAIMTANGSTHGAALMSRWFANPAIGPNLPDTTTVKMNWVLSYARAKGVYDKIMNEKLYANPAATAQIKKQYGSASGTFGDFSKPVPDLDLDYIQFRAVGSITDPIDDLFEALGKFTFRVVVKGCASKGGIAITHVGVYVKDSYDFNGSQVLGYWNKATNYGGSNPLKGTLVTNGDFRSYAKSTGFGDDFLVFSDLLVTKLASPEIILK